MWKGLYSCGDRVVKVSHAVWYNGCNAVGTHSMAVTGRYGCSYVYVCCFTKPVLVLHVIKCNYMHAWLFIVIFLATYFALCISVSVSEVVILVHLINDICKNVYMQCMCSLWAGSNCSNAEETTQLRRKATREKGPTTEPWTCDIRSFIEFQPRELWNRPPSFIMVHKRRYVMTEHGWFRSSHGWTPR